MSQRSISAAYALYRKYIEAKQYTLAKCTYKQYLAAAPVSMLRVAIYDYIV